MTDLKKPLGDLQLVEMLALGDGDEDCAYDQPCAFGHRVGGHSVYCHNEVAGYRKCGWRWRPRIEATACVGFADNPAYAGEHEAKEPMPAAVPVSPCGTITMAGVDQDGRPVTISIPGTRK